MKWFARRAGEKADGARRKKIGTQGAVLAEFALAATPLLITFFSFVQVGKVFTASFVVRHAAVTSARAAAVIHKNDGDNNPGDNGSDDDINRAAQLAMGPWFGAGLDMNGTVNIQDSSSMADPYGTVKVTVPAVYNCDVPLGKYIVCGASATKNMTATASFPHQGAKYLIK